MTVKDKAAAKDGTEQESTRVWFRVVYVFDLSQTGGESLPGLPTECTGQGGDVCERLEAYAAEKGILVETRRIDGSAKGYASQKGSRITLADSLTVADRAPTLSHKIIHCLLHLP